MFCKKGVYKNYAKFIENYLVPGLGLQLKKKTVKKHLFPRTPPVAAFVDHCKWIFEIGIYTFRYLLNSNSEYTAILKITSIQHGGKTSVVESLNHVIY